MYSSFFGPHQIDSLLKFRTQLIQKGFEGHLLLLSDSRLSISSPSNLIAQKYSVGWPFRDELEFGAIEILKRFKSALLDCELHLDLQI